MRTRAKTKASERAEAASLAKAKVARRSRALRPDGDEKANDGQRVGVQSLGRAFAILEEVARHREGIGLADLSKRVGLHNSTAFHLAKTLVALGYIRQEPDSRRYRIGRPLFALAASALDEIEMVSLATPIMEELSAKTGESSHFAVRMGDAIVVIARTSGPGAFQLAERVGRRAAGALHCAGQGDPRRPAPRPARALSRKGRTQALDRQHDHGDPGTVARDRGSEAERNCRRRRRVQPRGALRRAFRSGTLPARSWVPSAFPARSGGSRCRH